MSTWVYATLTKRRLQGPSAISKSISLPDVSTYLDMVTALVPAEVLALHSTILSLTTKTELDREGNLITTITEPGTLRWAFWGLIFASIVLSILPRLPIKDLLDYFRILIPPAAFVAWAMLQKVTAFDAVFSPKLKGVDRTVIALFGAVLLGALAKVLADKADKKGPLIADKKQP